MKTYNTKINAAYRSVFCYIFSALLPILLMLTVYFLCGQWPFGAKGLYAFPDSYSQYTNYYEYYRTIGQNGGLYSFSRTLGGDLVGFFTYYMLSPYNLLFLLLPNIAVGELMTVITLLKIGSCGLTFSIMLNHGQKPVPSTLLFSTSYALMGYLIIYSQNMNFMDAVILLPLVILGLRRLILNKRSSLYIVFLAMSLIINYYTGYMICIFSVLYFTYELLLYRAFHWKDILERIKLFLLSSLIAGGLSAVTLIPAVCSLSGGRGPGSFQGLFHFTSQFRIVDFLSRWSVGAFAWEDISSALPNIYAGMIILALCMLFFCSKYISLREKLISGIFLLILFLSCKLYFFNTVWHCFNEPHGSPVRYSYMISCLVILLAYRYYTTAICPLNTDSAKDTVSADNVDAIGLWPMLISGILFLTAALFVYKQYYPYMTRSKMLLSVTFFASCYVLLLLHRICVCRKIFPVLQKFFLPVLGVLCCLELTVNACNTYSVFPFRDIDYQAEYSSKYEPAIAYVKETDTGLYRMEKTTSITTNDPMLYNYRGISHDSSFHKFTLQDFCDNLGLTSHGSIIHYDTNAALSTDCLLGVKYLLSETAPNSFYQPICTTDEGVTIYENPWALPLMFLADAVTFDTIPEDNQPFAFQNAVFSALTGNEAPIFLPCDAASVTTENLYEFQITAQNTAPMYAFFQSETPYAELYINDEKFTSLNSNQFDMYFNGLIPLGEHQPGETITIRIEPLSDSFSLSEPEFYYQDTAALAADNTILTADNPQIRQTGNSSFEVHISSAAESSYLLFTVPYDAGWNIRVDGVKTDAVAAFDALLAVPVSTGEHAITFSYIPSGLRIGILVTILSAAAWITCTKKNIF